MTGWMSDLITAMINGVLDALTTATLAALNWVLTLLTDTVFTSPDVTTLPQVAYLSGRALIIANACLVLIVTVAGALAMTHGTLQDRHALKELLPRMLVGFLAANLAVPIVSWTVTAANALTEALSAGDVTSQDSFAQIRRAILGATTDPARGLAAEQGGDVRAGGDDDGLLVCGPWSACGERGGEYAAGGVGGAGTGQADSGVGQVADAQG
jgi:hypothetical protein